MSACALGCVTLTRPPPVVDPQRVHLSTWGRQGRGPPPQGEMEAARLLEASKSAAVLYLNAVLTHAPIKLLNSRLMRPVFLFLF